MSTALNYFLNENRLIADVDSPHEAIDFAYLLDEKDWKTLAEKWESHSDKWKVEVTTFAGLVPLRLSAPVILRALHTNTADVVLQSLLSIYESIMVERYSEENTGHMPFRFSAEDKIKILSEIKPRISVADDHAELIELKAMMENL